MACSLHNAPMPIIQVVLRTKKFSIKASPADGHCLFYSLLSSWNSQLYNQPRLTLQQVKDLLCNELHQNLDIYAPSISVDKASRNQQLELYLRYKRYKQPICDVFPIIAANALKTELCIINETGNNSCDLITLPPRSPNELPTLYLHRINGNHYNGLQSFSAQNRHQTTPSAVPPAIPQVDNHAVLHSASQVNCRTKSSVAHTPWQISSEGGQSRAMQAPACIRYSAAELRYLRHSHKLNRSVRKSLFKYNIWQPRSRSSDIFFCWIHFHGGSSKYNHRIIKCPLCLY